TVKSFMDTHCLPAGDLGSASGPVDVHRNGLGKLQLPPGFGLGSGLEPERVTRKCWLLPPLLGHWMSCVPSAVPRPKTSSNLPLWRAVMRTSLLVTSVKENC